MLDDAPRPIDMPAEKVDVLLRDEKEYIGILRSYDQFGMRLSLSILPA